MSKLEIGQAHYRNSSGLNNLSQKIAVPSETLVEQGIVFTALEDKFISNVVAKC